MRSTRQMPAKPTRATTIMLTLTLAATLSGCGKKKASSHALAPLPTEVSRAAGAAGAAGAASAAADAPASGARVQQEAAAVPGCTVVPEPLRVPGAKRIVAIGDLHGDGQALEAALRAARAIDDSGRWTGGELVVVQTGDILDRGDDEQQILDRLEQLEGEAKAAGGALYWLLGNHELMNAAGDFRYVTPGGFTDFDDVAGLDRKAVADAPVPVQARLAALAVATPPGPYRVVLAGQETVRIVGDTVFAHAGVVGEWAAKLEQINLENRCWLAGQLQARGTSSLLDDGSPVWTRALGLDPVDCARLLRTLAELGAKRMVVGHTVQLEGITSVCDGALWRIDVGLGAHYGGPIQVLELSGEAAKVLAGRRAK
jgi:hypothetical protein